MAPKLSTATLVRREDIVVGEDFLIVLENESTKDRMRRILFEQVTRLTVCQRFPVLHMSIVGAILGIPACLLPLTRDVAGYWSSAICFLILGLLALRYAWYKQTILQVEYLGGERKFKTIARPGKARRFVETLRENIERAQAAARAAQAAAPASAAQATAAIGGEVPGAAPAAEPAHGANGSQGQVPGSAGA